MIYFVIGLFVAYTAIKVFLELLELNYIKKEKNSPVILDEKEYKEAALIAITNLKFSIVQLIYSLLIALCWVLFGLKLLYFFGDGTFFVLAFLIIGALLNIPFSIYERFVKDKKFGFSNIDAKTYILDTIKTFALLIVFGSAIIWTLLFCIEKLGALWWLWAFVVSFSIIIVINIIYPTIIAPLFNKMTPLEDGELKEQIEQLMQKCGFKSNGLFIMDASKRDSRLNAYFGGLGSSKRVVLFDTLIKKLTINEILAVLAHELGHFRHGDIYKNIALMGVVLFAMFFIVAHIPTSFFEVIGLREGASSYLIFFLLFSPLFNILIEPLLSYLSRENEFGADEFSAINQNKEDMISALKKLALENKAFPKAHPLYAAIYFTHPTLYERITKLKDDAI